jgi:hypothetical protein
VNGGQSWFKSNYIGLFTGFNTGDIISATAASDPTKLAAFGMNRGAKLRDFLDGTSNTMIVAEYLTGASSNEFRGFAWGDQSPATQLFATNTPNSAIPDICYDISPTSWCTNNPSQNLPATADTNVANETASSRSRHAGGVHVVLGDGSVRFVSNSISLTIWRGLATIAGSEVIGEF